MFLGRETPRESLVFAIRYVIREIDFVFRAVSSVESARARDYQD